jgi:hypothetical protein
MNIAKNRSGTVGDFELLFNKNMSTFSNLTVSADDQYGEKQPMDDR